MGANYEGQDKAVEELQKLSPEAKKYLSHHIRNSLLIIVTGIDTGNLDTAKEAAFHIVSDLEDVGC